MSKELSWWERLIGVKTEEEHRDDSVKAFDQVWAQSQRA